MAWFQGNEIARRLETIPGIGVFLVTLPMVMISLGLESIDREVIEAARTMGADDRRTLSYGH